MKKLFPFALVAAVALPLFAQEPEVKSEAQSPREERKRESNSWSAFFAVCEFPANRDVIGLRLTIPFSTKQENVSGLDLGFWGRSLYFRGIQLNLLRNDVKDDMAGFQVGLYNTIGGGHLGLQLGLFNEANSMRGVQAGLVNFCGEAEGLQIGLINRSETMHGYQVGLINIIRDAELEFCPIVNVGW